jgi:hypothetical protein
MAELRVQLKKYPLTGPRVLTIGGLAGAPVLLMVGGLLSLVSSFDYDSDDGAELGDGTVMLYLSPVALVAGIVGAVWLVRKKRERRPYALEWRSLKTRRAELLEMAPALTPSSFGTTLRMRF